MKPLLKEATFKGLFMLLWSFKGCSRDCSIIALTHESCMRCSFVYLNPATSFTHSVRGRPHPPFTKCSPTPPLQNARAMDIRWMSRVRKAPPSFRWATANTPTLRGSRMITLHVHAPNLFPWNFSWIFPQRSCKGLCKSCLKVVQRVV